MPNHALRKHCDIEFAANIKSAPPRRRDRSGLVGPYDRTRRARRDIVSWHPYEAVMRARRAQLIQLGWNHRGLGFQAFTIARTEADTSSRPKTMGAIRPQQAVREVGQLRSKRRSATGSQVRRLARRHIQVRAAADRAKQDHRNWLATDRSRRYRNRDLEPVPKKESRRSCPSIRGRQRDDRSRANNSNGLEQSPRPRPCNRRRMWPRASMPVYAQRQSRSRACSIGWAGPTNTSWTFRFLE